VPFVQSSVPFVVKLAGEPPLIIQLQHRHERAFRDLHIAHRLHALLAFLLFFEELALTADVAAIFFRSLKHYNQLSIPRISQSVLFIPQNLLN
jgi:hypothetical protein